MTTLPAIKILKDVIRINPFCLKQKEQNPNTVCFKDNSGVELLFIIDRTNCLAISSDSPLFSSLLENHINSRNDILFFSQSAEFGLEIVIVEVKKNLPTEFWKIEELFDFNNEVSRAYRQIQYGVALTRYLTELLCLHTFFKQNVSLQTAFKNARLYKVLCSQSPTGMPKSSQIPIDKTKDFSKTIYPIEYILESNGKKSVSQPINFESLLKNLRENDYGETIKLAQ